MGNNEKLDILEKVASLPKEDQKNLAFFVAGMVAKSEPKEQPEKDGK